MAITGIADFGSQSQQSATREAEKYWISPVWRIYSRMPSNRSATIANGRAVSWQFIHTTKNKIFLPGGKQRKDANTSSDI